VRSRYRWLSPSIAVSGLLDEFTDVWMMRKMLLNLRDRAEGRLARDPSGSDAGSEA